MFKRRSPLGVVVITIEVMDEVMHCCYSATLCAGRWSGWRNGSAKRWTQIHERAVFIVSIWQRRRWASNCNHHVSLAFNMLFFLGKIWSSSNPKLFCCLNLTQPWAYDVIRKSLKGFGKLCPADVSLSFIFKGKIFVRAPKWEFLMCLPDIYRLLWQAV